MASSSIFLQKTYSMLSQAPPSVLSWSTDGNSFFVYDVAALEASLLARYFNHSNFASFSRQLRFYGFEKTRYRRRGAKMVHNQPLFNFRHAHFRRDAPDAMKVIRRKTFHITDDGVSKEQVEELKDTIARLELQLHALVQQASVLAMVIQAACIPEPAPVVLEPPAPHWCGGDATYYDEDLATVLLHFSHP
ncbi:hypothetical protein ACHHYP_01663 [Achlya hypogyna]|uniref:HSF-type DNA-binding domain-containing protein n=1 Tax=Achlya hypogyna TaxID=1202772 RepID=A0A1V9Z830_ACHHY|nr:hypothetical protein ACHHYP_01663 [Achlya hypogyna]